MASCSHRFARLAARCPPFGLVIVLLLAATAAGAVERPTEDPVVLAGRLEDRVQLLDGWRYHPGDDPSWSNPAFDDSAWPVASSTLDASADPAGGWPGIGWFRRRLTLADGMPPTALAIRIEQNGASDLYLDGRLVGSYGTVSADPAAERPVYPNDFDGIALEPGTTHVLAVRYSNSRDNRFRGAIRGFGFNMRSVASAAAAYNRWAREVTLVPAVFAGAFAALAVLHLLLFGFHPASREHLLFATFAGATATAMGLKIAVALETDLIARLQTFRWYVAVTIAMVLIGLAVVHQVFRRRPAWTSWAVVFAGAAIVVWVWTWQAFQSALPVRIFIAAAFLEMLRLSIAALVIRREAEAWIVALGFAPLAVVTLIALAFGWAGRPFSSPLAESGTLVVLALAFSVFISRRAARTARELEQRLGEVRELSERALEQERRAIHEETERRLLEAKHRQRSEELEAARRLQLAMLPHLAPEIPGFDLAYRMATATEVGGDYVDMRLGAGGQALLAVGDATSHGLQAGMVVAVAKSLFQGVDPDESPSQVLDRIGAGLQSMRERHASMAMVVISAVGGRLRVASAGMPPVLVCRRGTGSVEEILLPGVPLGTLADVEYPVREVSISTGDKVLVMSDGVAEAAAPTGEAFGYDRVASYFRRANHRPAEEIVDGLFEAVTSFADSSPLLDDVTVLVLVAK